MNKDQLNLVYLPKNLSDNSNFISTDDAQYQSQDNKSNENKTDQILDDSDIYEDEEELPMALIVEDDLISQLLVIKEVKEMNFRYKTATTVNEAKEAYLECAKEEISIDIMFLDILLKDNSTGIEFLKIIRENKWMERTLIIVMSGLDNINIVNECYNFKIFTFIQKPLTKSIFNLEKKRIIDYFKKNRCPIEGYKTIKKIGTGASGTVYLIKNIKTKELCALKQVPFPKEEKIINYQLNEIKYLKNLLCPTIIEIKESKIKENFIYMILEYAEFGTLYDLIQKKIKNGEYFEPDEILTWMTEIIIGLYIIHQKGIMHRDIKSENLFLCSDNIMKIGDFGISKNAESAQTFCGTPSYMAPEMFNFQEYNFKVDIWSAGVVLYELVMFKKPFQRNIQGEEELKDIIINEKYEQFPALTDPRLKRLLNLMLNVYEKRASAYDLLSLYFIREKIDLLFSTVFINEKDLYDKLKKIPILQKGEYFSYEKEFIKNYNKTEYKIYKNIFILYYSNSKYSFSKYFFSIPTKNLIKEYCIKYPTNQITSEDIKNILKLNYFSKIITNNKKLGNLYKLNVYENENVDNSIRFSMHNEDKIFDPVDLSIKCLELVVNLWITFKKILKEKGDEIQFISSEDFYTFLLTIKRLKYLKFDEYSSDQKLAIILNIYQTMYYHYIIKTFFYEESNNPNDIVQGIVNLFLSLNDQLTLNYNISGRIISIYQMKHAIIRRNRKPPDSYFKATYDKDPIINFIDEKYDIPLEKFIKLECVCLDPPDYSDFKNIVIVEPILTRFKNNSINEQLTEHFQNFLLKNINFNSNYINLPWFFHQYIKDFENNELLLIKILLKEICLIRKLRYNLEVLFKNFSKGKYSVIYYKNWKNL